MSNSLLQSEYFTLNETKALRSLFNYYKDDDEDASTSVICLAIINDLGRTHLERSCMRRAVEELLSSSIDDETPKTISFLTILDHGRKLIINETSDESKNSEDLTSLRYHLLRLLRDYQERCNAQGKYLLAKEFMEAELSLRKEEEERQINLLRRKHDNDRTRLVMAHKQQFREYEDKWTIFMDEFEQSSQKHVNELGRTHQEQLDALKAEMLDTADNVESKPKKKWSIELIQLREKQEKHARNQNFVEAQTIKQMADILEEKERLKIDTITDNSFHLKQQNLMKKHQKEMDALHKRFEGSRGSHATQRHEGCMHLRHRNKIILTTFDSKHEEECSKIDIEEQVKKLLLHDSC